jgi:Ca-activated chloride channel homolog
MSRRLLIIPVVLLGCVLFFAFAARFRETGSTFATGFSDTGSAPATPGEASQSGSSTPSTARATIVGSVVDGALSPLAGVNVILERGGRAVQRTATGADGKFRFADVPPGDYRVRAELAGFPTFSRSLHVKTGATAIQFPVVLTRAGDTLPAAGREEAGPIAQSVPRPPPPSPAMPPPSAIPQTATGTAAGGRGGGVADLNASIDRMAPAEARTAVTGISSGYGPGIYWPRNWPRPSGESYAHIDPNRFQFTRDEPLSTFGADVDTASYTNVRRFLSSGQLPPHDAVRVEELVNYFRFNYASPRGPQPLALTTEIGDCPWAPSHKLVLIGARARASAPREIEGRNLVLLIDVSGSMAPVERLPLIKTALGLFVDTLRPDDRLAIVTYAGSSGVALPSTPVRQRDVIQRAIANLSAGGSTNGGQGLIMAYRVAREAFIPGGVNRVILATDGDFNVGIVSRHDLLQLIERERDSGVFLSVFGVGSGNLKDSTMEMLADRGNGHYAYLDSLQEARRVLVREGDATLETVAKDVKFQVEFNPAVVAQWKLIGYEDRALAAQDFNDDRKDAGEMGAGHTVTVLYEVIPVGVSGSLGDDQSSRAPVDPLKYRTPSASVTRPAVVTDGAHAGEWLTVKARFKMPEGESSDLITQAVRAGGRAQHLVQAAAVAEFGLLLRDHPRDAFRWDALLRRVAAIDMPASSPGDTESFKELVAIAAGLARLRGQE